MSHDSLEIILIFKFSQETFLLLAMLKKVALINILEMLINSYNYFLDKYKVKTDSSYLKCLYCHLWSI